MSSVNLKRQKEINAQMSEVMDDFDRFEFFFADHWKQVVGVAVGIVVAVAVVFSVMAYSSHRQTQAAAAFNQAADIPQLEDALAKFNGAAAAPAARVRLAGLYIAGGKYDQARAELKLAASDADAPEIMWRAQLNLGYLTELENKFAEAADVFAAFAQTTAEAGSAGYRAEAYANAGRLFIKVGKLAEAREILETGRGFAAGGTPDEQAAAQGFGAQINFLLAQLENGAFGKLPAAAK